MQDPFVARFLTTRRSRACDRGPEGRLYFVNVQNVADKSTRWSRSTTRGPCVGHEPDIRYRILGIAGAMEEKNARLDAAPLFGVA